MIRPLGTDVPKLLRQADAKQAHRERPDAIARTRTLTGFQVVGVGSYVPDRVVTNEQLEQELGFDADWIRQRMGILERRHAQPGQATSDLCAEAARRCLDSAGADPSDVDLLVLATYTPDMAFPSTACLVQDQLGLRCGAFDMQAACAGFMYALSVGAQFVKTGSSRLCLVVGGDANSRIIDPQDLKTYPLFGDGAGAVLLAEGSKEQGFLAYQLGSDGAGGQLLSRPAGGSRMPPEQCVDERLHFLQMDGRAVFRWAVNTVTDSSNEILDYAEVDVANVDLFLPHQANIRIINAVGDVLGFPRDRVVHNIHRLGNTSAGSIPLVLDEAYQDGRIDRGDLLLMTGFGAGLNWGTALVRW